MLYRLLERDKEKSRIKLLEESDQYEKIWDGWAQRPEDRVIVCKAETGTRGDGKYYWHLVSEGRKPGIYNNREMARQQTKGITRDPTGYGATPSSEAQLKLVQHWLDARIIRREERDVEIVRKSCGCCWYCGATLVTAYGKYLGEGQRDHQTSRVNRGGNEIGNLVLACEKCNTAEKNSLDLEEYREKVLQKNPEKYPDGVVKFFGELPQSERHRIKQEAEPHWICPGTVEIPCTCNPG